jgi:hypothetical protein
MGYISGDRVASYWLMTGKIQKRDDEFCVVMTTYRERPGCLLVFDSASACTAAEMPPRLVL